MRRATALRLTAAALLLAGTVPNAAAEDCPRPGRPHGSPEIGTPAVGTPYGPAEARAGWASGTAFAGGRLGRTYVSADGDPSGVRVYAGVDQFVPFVQPHVIYAALTPNGPAFCARPPSD